MSTARTVIFSVAAGVAFTGLTLMYLIVDRQLAKTPPPVASTNIEQKVETKAIGLPDVGAKVKLFGYEYVCIRTSPLGYVWLAHRNPTDGTIVYTELTSANYVILVSRSN